MAEKQKARSTTFPREAKQPLSFYREQLANLASHIHKDLPNNAPLHDLYSATFSLSNLINDANVAIAKSIADNARLHMPDPMHPKGVHQHTDFIFALATWVAPDEWQVQAAVIGDFLKIAPAFVRKNFPVMQSERRLDPEDRREMVVSTSELLLSEWRTDNNEWNMPVRERFHMHLVAKGMERALKMLMDEKGFTGKRYLIVLIESLERLQISLLRPQPPLTPDGTKLAGKMIGLNVEIVEKTEAQGSKRKKMFSRQPDPGSNPQHRRS